MSGTPGSTAPSASPATPGEEGQVDARPSQTQRMPGGIVHAIATALWSTVDVIVWTMDQSRPAPRDFAHTVTTPQVVETKKAPVAPRPPLGERIRQSWLYQVVRRLKHDLVLSVIPTLDLLDGEVIKLDIHQAAYRDIVPRRIFDFWWAILLATVALTLAIGYAAQQAGGSWAFGLFAWVIPLVVFAWAAEEWIHYQQWRLVITNYRTVLYVPTPHSHWLVDDIRLPAGRIQVVDVNFSPSRWWRLFQIATGARDLVISISGYGFKANTAEVRDGLIIPDVASEDIKRLEELVFKK